MKQETITFDARFPDANLVTYIHEPFNDTHELAIHARRAMIVCPGGGYAFLSEREAEPVALQYFAAGFNVFILNYSVNEQAANGNPVKEAALAIRYVREHSSDFRIDPAYVFIGGFSAGGHLAASSGCLWNAPEVREVLVGSPEGIGKPTGTILCYPVITTGKYGHDGSTCLLCGSTTPSNEVRDHFSLEKQVKPTTAPAFIWCTRTDNLVPVQNSLLYAAALAEAGVGFELHIYPEGPHGLSLCNAETWSKIPAMLVPTAEDWMAKSIRWAKELKV